MIEFSKPNFIIKVESKRKLSEIQDYLKSHSQFIPIGPFNVDYSIIDIIDFNLFGDYGNEFGQVKDWVINLELNTSNKDLILGADIVKNVSGYNLFRLIVGARGELGKINWVTFRTLPIHKMKEIDSSQILNGVRIVTLPEYIFQIKQYIENKKLNYKIYNEIAVIDIAIKKELIISEFEKNDYLKIKKYVKKLYQLKNGIPILINPNKNQTIIEEIKSNFKFN
jgi:hypothetical protein